MRTQGREGGWGIYTRGASSDSLGLVSKILLLNRSLSLFLVQLQAVPEQRNLILVVFKTTTLAFHGADLRPRALRARVWEGELSDHVACLATSEPGAPHSGGTGLGGGTLCPCGLPGHIGSRCAPLRGHGRDPPPWHHRHWWDAAWREGQGCGPVAGPGRGKGQMLGHGAVLLGLSGFGGRGDGWLWAELGARSFAAR